MTTISNNDIKRWKKMSQIVTSGDEYYADEVLGIVLEKLVIKLNNFPDFDLNDNYVFISLRNNYWKLSEKDMNYLKMKQTYCNELNYIDTIETDNLKAYDDKLQSKLDIVPSVVETMDYFNKQLYLLHFVKGMSQRKIARESGIGLITIHKKINLIKTKIKDTYNGKEENN